MVPITRGKYVSNEVKMTNLLWVMYDEVCDIQSFERDESMDELHCEFVNDMLIRYSIFANNSIIKRPMTFSGLSDEDFKRVMINIGKETVTHIRDYVQIFKKYSLEPDLVKILDLIWKQSYKFEELLREEEFKS